MADRPAASAHGTSRPILGRRRRRRRRVRAPRPSATNVEAALDAGCRRVRRSRRPAGRRTWTASGRASATGRRRRGRGARTWRSARRCSSASSTRRPVWRARSAGSSRPSSSGTAGRRRTGRPARRARSSAASRPPADPIDARRGRRAPRRARCPGMHVVGFDGAERDDRAPTDRSRSVGLRRRGAGGDRLAARPRRGRRASMHSTRSSTSGSRPRRAIRASSSRWLPPPDDVHDRANQPLEQERSR